MPNYFLVSLSNRNNLELCLQYGLAGFPGSANGFWTFLEIDEGDYVSFLYGARLWNLYQVREKLALRNAEKLPPWPPVVLKQTYYFPFRLKLEPIRQIRESLVRPEFAYIAENLLPRSGYRKTHFQADQTTLQSVSQLGEPYSSGIDPLPIEEAQFTPLIKFEKGTDSPPGVFKFRELILQALVKKYLRTHNNLEGFLSKMGLKSWVGETLEILGELALSEGQVDAVLKEAIPIGASSKVAIEVKLNAVSTKDLDQLGEYVKTIGKECHGGALIGKTVSSRTVTQAKELGLNVFVYDLNALDLSKKHEFADVLSAFSLRLA